MPRNQTETLSAQPDLSELKPPSQLRRDVALTDAIGIGLGAIIGAGIFVVTGLAAKVAGPSFILGLFVAAVAASCNALSAAELAATYPQSGGTYEYGYRLLNPIAGFAAGWMFVVSKIAAGGTVALGLASYCSAFLPHQLVRVAAVVIALILTGLNLLGIKKAGKLNLTIVAVTLTGLLAFVVMGTSSVQSAHFHPFLAFGWRGMFQSAALMFFAYTGYARVATLSEEVHDPARTIPRAVIWSLAISVCVYAAVSIVATGIVGAPALAASPSPLQTAARALHVHGVVAAVSVAGITAMIGVLLSQIMGVSRTILAMARRADLPPVLATIDGTVSVPRAAVIVTGAAICLIGVFGRLDLIAQTASLSILLYYGIANVAALKLPRESRLFRPVVPALGLALCAILALSVSPVVIGYEAILLALGFGLRAILKFGIRKPTTENA